MLTRTLKTIGMIVLFALLVGAYKTKSFGQTVSITKDVSLGNNNIVAGSVSAALGQFFVRANADSIAVESITIGTGTTNTFPYSVGNINAFAGNKISNVRLYKWTGSVWSQVGPTISTPSTSPVFSGLGLLVPANDSVRIRIIGNIAVSGVSESVLQLGDETVTGTIISSGNPYQTECLTDLQQMMISVEPGQLTASIDHTSGPASQILVASETYATIADMKFSANIVENIELTKIVVGGLGFSTNVTRVYLYDGATKIGEQPLTLDPATSEYYAVFDSMNIAISKGSSKILTLKVDISAIQALATNSESTRYLAPFIMSADAIGIESVLPIKASMTPVNADNFAPNGTQSSVFYEFVYSSDALSGTTYPTFGFTTNTDNFTSGNVVLNGVTTLWDSTNRISRLGYADATSTTANVNYDVGDIVYVYDGNGLVKGAGFAIVKVPVAIGQGLSGICINRLIGDDVGLGGTTPSVNILVINITKNTSNTPGSLYLYPRIAPRPFRCDDVEIGLSNAMTNTTLPPQANQMIGRFNVQARWQRDLTISKIKVVVNGDNNPFSPYTVGAICSNDDQSGCKVNSLVLKDANDVVVPSVISYYIVDNKIEFELVGPITITQGQSKEFRVYANTSNVKMNGNGVPVTSQVNLTTQIPGEPGPFPWIQGGIIGSYVSAYDNSTTVVLDISDDLPLYGATISYGGSTDIKEGVTPKVIRLNQNYPNPFNPTTTISYELPISGVVSVKVYNTLGQEVRTLVNNSAKMAGFHSVTWDGKDNSGKEVSSGIYLYRLQTGNTIINKKMLFVK